MAPQFRGTSSRRLSAWPWRRRRSGSTLALAVLPLALLMAWPAAPVVAQAAPATTLAGLLSSPSTCVLGLIGCGTSPAPSGPCVLGTLLCGGNLISQPTACASGLLCTSPSASPCVGGAVLCQGTILGPGNPSPASSPPTGGQPGGGLPKGTTGATTPGPGTTNVALAFGVPPGVGLVPPAAGRADGGTTPNPDGLSELLTLSIREGLSPGGSQLWPALAMLQAVLLLVIVGGFAAGRVLEASKPPEG